MLIVECGQIDVYKRQGYSPAEIEEKINPIPESGRIRNSPPEITGQQDYRQDAGTLRNVIDVYKRQVLRSARH